MKPKSRGEACDHYSQEDVNALDEALDPWGPDKDAPVEDATNGNKAL
jgi:hypothetical protein